MTPDENGPDTFARVLPAAVHAAPECSDFTGPHGCRCVLRLGHNFPHQCCCGTSWGAP